MSNLLEDQFKLSFIRKRIQDQRAIIADITSEYYYEAVKRDDLSYFFEKIDPQVLVYRKLYKIKRIINKLKKVIGI